MGKLAKADGRVSEIEVSHVEQFMQKLRMTPDYRLKAIGLFKQGASGDYDIHPKINEFLTVCGSSPNLKQMLLVYLIIMGLSDGQLNAAEEELLRTVAGRLGYHPAAFEQLLVTPSPHGYHQPFISWLKRSMNGWPQFLAAVAQVRM